MLLSVLNVCEYVCIHVCQCGTSLSFVYKGTIKKNYHCYIWLSLLFYEEEMM